MNQSLGRTILMIWAAVLLFVCASSCHYQLGSNGVEPNGAKKREFTDPLYNVFALGGEKAWVIGYHGTVLCTSDGGVSWKKSETGTHEALYGIYFVDGTQGWVSGSNGIILTTRDGGKTWSRQESGTEKHLFDIHFVDPLHGMAVGYYGVILRTSDGGGTWEDISLKDDISLNALDLVDMSSGWVVGEFGSIHHTEDFGTTWTQTKVPVEEASLFGVDFASKTLGYVTGMDGIILKTEDGGNIWTKQESHSTDAIFSIQIAGDTVWAVGLKGTALQSTVSSVEWQPIADMKGVWGWIRAVHFAGPTVGWMVGSNGMIFRFTDGRKWTEIVL
jgi:photosystem II stability/assembly factor-like uncharacterized protein